jgi:hypothetical protein
MHFARGRIDSNPVVSNSDRHLPVFQIDPRGFDSSSGIWQSLQFITPRHLHEPPPYVPKTYIVPDVPLDKPAAPIVECRGALS